MPETDPARAGVSSFSEGKPRRAASSNVLTPGGPFLTRRFGGRDDADADSDDDAGGDDFSGDEAGAMTGSSLTPGGPFFDFGFFATDDDAESDARALVPSTGGEVTGPCEDLWDAEELEGGKEVVLGCSTVAVSGARAASGGFKVATGETSGATCISSPEEVLAGGGDDAGGVEAFRDPDAGTLERTDWILNSVVVFRPGLRCMLSKGDLTTGGLVVRSMAGEVGASIGDADAAEAVEGLGVTSADTFCVLVDTSADG